MQSLATATALTVGPCTRNEKVGKTAVVSHGAPGHYVRMAILRSRRLEHIFGTPLEEITAEHIRALVTNRVSEAADLEFKGKVPDGSERERVKLLLKPAAALANSIGGVIVYGVEEDAQKLSAAAAPGVSLSDATELQMRQAIASNISPLPLFDLVRVYDSPARDHGFYLLIVAAGGSTPHSFKAGAGYRYPRKNGASTIDLTETEIAAAYRDRFRARDERTQRLADVTAEAQTDLGNEPPWLIVSMVPDVAGGLRITRPLYEEFETAWRRRSVWAFGPRLNSQRFNHCRVGPDRLHADDGLQRFDRKGLTDATKGLVELHTDGSGAHALALKLRSLRRRGLLRLRPGGDSGRHRPGASASRRACRAVRWGQRSGDHPVHRAAAISAQIGRRGHLYGSWEHRSRLGLRPGASDTHPRRAANLAVGYRHLRPGAPWPPPDDGGH